MHCPTPQAILWGRRASRLCFQRKSLPVGRWRGFQGIFWKGCHLGVVPAPVAKITRPVLPGTYPRKRLYRLLDQARKVPITWVSGPPGCGKTTTVSGYVEARRLRGIWYQVDEGDGDPATFFYYLGLAGRKAAPRKRVALAASDSGVPARPQRVHAPVLRGSPRAARPRVGPGVRQLPECPLRIPVLQAAPRGVVPPAGKVLPRS